MINNIIDRRSNEFNCRVDVVFEMFRTDSPLHDTKIREELLVKEAIEFASRQVQLVTVYLYDASWIKNNSESISYTHPLLSNSL
jgi:hypothetical protein